MASLAQRAENVPGTRQNHCAVGAELPNWARINFGGAILADFDAEKQVVALAKVLKVQDDSIKELTRRVQEAHMTTLPDEVMKKIDMLQRMFAGMRNAQEATSQATAKLGHNIGMAEDLGKTETKFKILTARIEALAAQIEALARNSVSRADLLALEKKLTDAMKKAK